MRHYLLISHGTLAEGMKSSVELITGKQENLYFINAYIDGNTNIPQEVAKIIDQYIAQGDELLIFTDILGGSVNNAVTEFTQNPQIHIITGMNLPLVLNILLEDNGTIGADIESSLELAKENMCYYNKYIKNTVILDEDF